MTRRPAGAKPLDHNLQRSVGAARSLTLAVSGVQKGMGDAAGAAGILAENIAKASGNAKVASGALGIGAIVAVGLELVQIWKAATDQMKEFNTQMNAVGADTKVLQLQGINASKDYLARRQAIINAGEKEVALAEKIANEEEKKAFRAESYKKTRAAIAALDREIARQQTRTFEEQHSANDLALLGRTGETLGTSPRQREFAVGTYQAKARKLTAEHALDREVEDKKVTEKQAKTLREDIQAAYDREMDILHNHLAEEAQKVGDTFTESLAGSLSDGIAAAVSSGSIGDGFKALTGGILIGLGEMMQTIGTESLVAAKLFKGLVDALRSFDPEGAIGKSLLLIAAGGVLKGLGASMGGHRGGASSAGGYGGYGGYSPSATTYIGVLNPTSAPNTAGLGPATPVTVHATFIGKDDPRAQRELLEMISRAQRRGSTNG